MTGAQGLMEGRSLSYSWLFASLAILLTGASPIPAAAGGQQRQEQEIARCVRQASRGKLWLERTLWGLRDQEAGWIGAEVRNTNGTHDLGPLQINSWWVPRIARLIDRPEAHVRYWLRFDPCFNAEAARWIFLSALSVTGNYWQAVGTYHSPTAWRQARYTTGVVIKMKRRFGEDIFAIRASTR